MNIKHDNLKLHHKGDGLKENMPSKFADVFKRTAVLALSFSLCFSVTAFSAPPYDNIPSGMSEEQYAKLNDNVVEWSEIEELIKYRNPTYTALSDQALSSVDQIKSSIGTDVLNMQEQLDDVDSALTELYETEKSLKDKYPAGSVEGDMALKQLQAAIDQAKAGRTELKAAVKQLDDMRAQLEGRLTVSGKGGGVSSEKSIEIKLYPALESLRSAVEGLVLSYEQLNTSKSIYEEQLRLYQRLLSTQQNLFAEGMATAADVDSASNNVLSAQAKLSELEASKDTLGRNIGLLLGYKGEIPVIEAAPAPDITFLENADPVKDIEKASAENSDVRSSGKSNGTTSGNEQRYYTQNEAKGKLSAKLSELYADMQAKKLLYDSSASTLRKAEITKNSAELKLSMGMLSAAEYEAQMLSYISYKASAELAETNLKQSINNYKWALNGVVSID